MKCDSYHLRDCDEHCCSERVFEETPTPEHRIAELESQLAEATANAKRDAASMSDLHKGNVRLRVASSRVQAATLKLEKLALALRDNAALEWRDGEAEGVEWDDEDMPDGWEAQLDAIRERHK